jgi:uncharacterized protein (DUF1501 family)
MAKAKDPVVVVLQLSGGNDYLNTIVPYADSSYYDNRQVLGIAEDDVLRLDDEIGLHPTMGPLQQMYEKGDVAIIHGVGWSSSNRSHFRCMDIWHTAEPDAFATEGWLGKAARQIDPSGENPVTTVNIGGGLPRALAADGVSVASISDINAYGMLTAVEQEGQRMRMLERFANMYAPAIGSGPVMDYIGRTGADALKGADIIKKAPEMYRSEIEYASNPLAGRLRDVAQVHLAGLGTRILYTGHGGFDTHASQANAHPKLWTEVSGAIADFWDDLRAAGGDDNVIMLVFSEFGRRVKENGGGTDHGAAGAAFVIGPSVKGGTYGEYPGIKPEHLVNGDLATTVDFRSLYSTILDDWMGLDTEPIVSGRFERPEFIEA